MYRIHEIENGIIERIKAAKLPYLRFVGSYGGELMGAWEDVIRALPAVWVTFKGSGTPTPLNTAQTRWRVELRFTTIVAAKSLRSEKATRHGGEGKIGTYQLLNDVGRLIALQDFALEGVDYLRPRDIRSLFNAGTGSRAISVFAQNWTSFVDIHTQEPCAAPLPLPADPPNTGYVPPVDETFPGAEHPHYVPLNTLALRYWLKPPQDLTRDAPMAEDQLTLNIPV
ncbi:MAG: phage protein Gp37 [Desulfovibrionaceae bacterium]